MWLVGVVVAVQEATPTLVSNFCLHAHGGKAHGFSLFSSLHASMKVNHWLGNSNWDLFPLLPDLRQHQRKL